MGLTRNPEGSDTGGNQRWGWGFFCYINIQISHNLSLTPSPRVLNGNFSVYWTFFSTLKRSQGTQVCILFPKLDTVKVSNKYRVCEIVIYNDMMDGDVGEKYWRKRCIQIIYFHNLGVKLKKWKRWEKGICYNVYENQNWQLREV